jgi:hypothetical protein
MMLNSDTNCLEIINYKTACHPNIPGQAYVSRVPMKNELAMVHDRGQLQKIVVQPLRISFYIKGILRIIGI